MSDAKKAVDGFWWTIGVLILFAVAIGVISQVGQ